MQLVSLSNNRPFSLPWAIAPDAGPASSQAGDTAPATPSPSAPAPPAAPAPVGPMWAGLGTQPLGVFQGLLAALARLLRPVPPSAPPAPVQPAPPAPVSSSQPLPPQETAATILAAANQALRHAPDPIVGTFTASSFYLNGPNGVPNPNRDMRQVGRLQTFTTDMNALCQAYALTKDTRYAEKAAQLLDAWSTAMKPGYGNAQAHYEVYFHLSSVANSLQALQGYAGWGAARQAHSLDWLHGLASSALEMRAGGNNIDDWRNLFVGNVAVLTGDHALFQRTLSDWQSNIGSQIDANGMLPRELARAKSLNYSHYALKPLMAFAELARAQGIDLYGTAAGRKLELALQAVGPALVDHSLWKTRDVALNHVTPEVTYLDYRLAAARYPNNGPIQQVAGDLRAQLTAKPGWKARLVNGTLQGGNVTGMPLSVGAAFAN